LAPSLGVLPRVLEPCLIATTLTSSGLAYNLAGPGLKLDIMGSGLVGVAVLLSAKKRTETYLIKKFN